MNNSAIGDLQPVQLLEPAFNNCGTVFEALKTRSTCRTISAKNVSLQILSDILWSAQGVNRVKGPFGGPGRTAGSASNSQEIYIFIAMEEGTYVYEPDLHKIFPVVSGDIRVMAIRRGQRRISTLAPVHLIYVVDFEKFKSAGFQEPGLYDPEIQKSYYYVDTGLIAQNIYLAAASLGLVAWFHNCDKAELAKELGLKPHQHVLFSHTIGYAEG
jgi:hypothetical protein